MVLFRLPADDHRIEVDLVSIVEDLPPLYRRFYEKSTFAPAPTVGRYTLVVCHPQAGFSFD